MNVNWTEAALADLRAIDAYISHHSPQYGRSMVDRIFARSGVLADFPRLGAAVPEYADDALRELFEDPYRIVYRVSEDRVDVVAIVHTSRRMPRGL